MALSLSRQTRLAVPLAARVTRLALGRLTASYSTRTPSNALLCSGSRHLTRPSPSNAAHGLVRYARGYASEGSVPPVSKPDSAANAPQPDAKSALSRTPLYDFHVQQGAKMVPFAGYEMPLTYAWGGQLKEHEQVRKKAGLFDVSHMVQNVISGPGATQFMQTLVPSSMKALIPAEADIAGKPLGPDSEGPFLSSLSVMLNDNGGIIDDLMVTRQGDDSYYVVTNAGRRAEDLAHIKAELKKFNALNKTGVRHDVLENRGLLALQGPAAAEALQPHLPSSVDLSKLYFGQSMFAPMGPSGVRVHITRGGYTGEDGFEISTPENESIALAQLLMDGEAKSGKGGGLVSPVGLAARDSLRLEAGMCLYGHDLSEDVGPLEAALSWVVGEDRRANATFVGAKKALDAMATKAKTTRRIGLVVESGPPAREGTPIYEQGASESAEPIGKITSGIPSPTLKQNIAMGYVKFGYQKSGTQLEVRIRGKTKVAQVVRMPFVKPNYYRQPKQA